MRGILNCNFAAARRLCIIFLGRPYSTYVKCPYVRGREIWDWVEAVLGFLKTPPQRGGVLQSSCIPALGESGSSWVKAGRPLNVKWLLLLLFVVLLLSFVVVCY